MELYKSDAISSVEEDALGRKPFIEAVANFIKSQSTEVNKDKKKELRNLGDPLTIGIYGKWGYGKTSVINCVKTEVEKAKFFTAYYNPWMYNNEEDLVQHLFETIVSAVNVKEDIENRKELISKLKKYSLGFLKGFKARAKFGVPFTDIGVSVGYDAKPLIEAIEKDIDVDSDETIYDVKEEINKVLTSLSNPIVIFIDDIDRLSKTEIYTLFKTVRLIADFKNIIYVLSFDDEMVAKSIKEKFADGKDKDGFNYLEKIIDIPLRLPSYNRLIIKDYLYSKIDFTGSVPFFDNLFSFIVDEVITTPRQCSRVINSVSFLKSNLKHICNKYLFILEAIRLNRPDVYNIFKLYHMVVIKQQNLQYFVDLDKEALLREYHDQEDYSRRISASLPILTNFFKELFLIDILGKLEIFDINIEGRIYPTNSLLSLPVFGSTKVLSSALFDDYMNFSLNLD